MILMAIDHVRVYSGLPAGGPTAGIFFTRWVTHFVAPAFIFLAGTSAYFYGRKHTDLSRFLLVRGIWLVLLELTVIRICWTFNFDFANYLLAGVIWVIGWCMVLMAALVWPLDSWLWAASSLTCNELPSAGNSAPPSTSACTAPFRRVIAWAGVSTTIATLRGYPAETARQVPVGVPLT